MPWERLDARLRGHDHRGVIPAQAGIQFIIDADALVVHVIPAQAGIQPAVVERTWDLSIP